MYAGDGRRADRPRLDATRGVIVSRAAVAPALRLEVGAEREDREKKRALWCARKPVKSARQGPVSQVGETRTVLFTSGEYLLTGPSQLSAHCWYTTVFCNSSEGQNFLFLWHMLHESRLYPYGLRDEEYLRLKILTCMLPKL